MYDAENAIKLYAVGALTKSNAGAPSSQDGLRNAARASCMLKAVAMVAFPCARTFARCNHFFSVPQLLP